MFWLFCGRKKQNSDNERQFEEEQRTYEERKIKQKKEREKEKQEAKSRRAERIRQEYIAKRSKRIYRFLMGVHSQCIVYQFIMLQHLLIQYDKDRVREYFGSRYNIFLPRYPLSTLNN